MKLAGLSASRGNGEGKAIIIQSVADLQKMNFGDVMIVKHSNPAFANGLYKCSAVVSENGGILFHLAIMAREVGVPLISGVANATTLIKNGDNIKIVSTQKEGEVYVNE